MSWDKQPRVKSICVLNILKLVLHETQQKSCCVEGIADCSMSQRDSGFGAQLPKGLLLINYYRVFYDQGVYNNREIVFFVFKEKYTGKSPLFWPPFKTLLNIDPTCHLLEACAVKHNLIFWVLPILLACVHKIIGKKAQNINTQIIRWGYPICMLRKITPFCVIYVTLFSSPKSQSQYPFPGCENALPCSKSIHDHFHEEGGFPPSKEYQGIDSKFGKR